MNDERPMADPGRVEFAETVFAYREMSPAEWAARYSHGVGISSFDAYRYPDPALGTWIAELHRLFRSPAELDQLRRTYLSPAEYAEVRADIAYSAEHGF